MVVISPGGQGLFCPVKGKEFSHGVLVPEKPDPAPPKLSVYDVFLFIYQPSFLIPHSYINASGNFLLRQDK